MKISNSDSGEDQLLLTATYRTSKRKLIIKCGSIVSFISIVAVLTWYLTKVYNTQSCKPVFPGPPDSLDVYNVTDLELWCHWDRPSYPNLTIDGYNVTIENQKEHEIKTISTNKNQYTFNELEPWTWYTIRVSAYTLHDACISDALYGPEQTASARTSVSAPTVPTHPWVKSVTNTSIEIAWDRPDVPNGPIDGYLIRNLNETPSHDISTKSTSYLFTSLKPWSKYAFSIRAFNRFKGSALYGPELVYVAQAGGLPPSAPTNPKVKETRNTSVELTWEKPLFPNGPLDGYILCNLNKTPSLDITVTDTSYKFNDLDAWTNYTFSIRAFNSFEGSPLIGPSVTIAALTKGSAPPYSLGKLKVNSTLDDSVSLIIPTELFSSTAGPIVEYVLMVEKKKDEEMIWRQGYDKLNESEFLTWSQADGTNQWYRTSPINWNYKTDTKLCKIGDQGTVLCLVGVQKDCSASVEYCNGPLRPTTQYWAKLRAYTDYGWTDTYPVTFTTTVKPSSAGNLKPSVICALLTLTCLLWRHTMM